MPDASADAIIRRLNELKSLRTPHEATWRDCFDHSFPIRGSGIQAGVPMTTDEAQRRKADLVDDTATHACQILASSLMGGMTPANARWFTLTIDGVDDVGQQWLDDAADTLWQNIHQANFDAAALECNLDITAAGWAVLYIEENTDEGGLSFEQWPLAQCYIAASKRGGAIDTIYREYTLRAEQAFREFGDELSDDAQKLAREKPDDKIELLHAIYPRGIYAVGGRLARNMPFASCHVEVAKQRKLREGGYHEFPCAVPRWRLIPDSHYAVGPMLDALPTTRRLNAIGRGELAALDLAVAGMWIAENDGILNPRTVKVGPRKIIVAASVDSMKPLLTGSDFNASFSKGEEMRAQIRKILMADQLQPQDGPAMTATEVHARMALIRQLLGPMFGRLQSEFLQVLVERTFGLAFRAGALGVPPDSITGREYGVKYESPLARAARLEEVTAMDGYETVLMTQASADQTAMDGYDWDEARRERAKLMGVPLKLLRSKDDIAAIQEERQAAAQQQQQQQMAQQAQLTMLDAAGKQMAKA